MLKYAAQAKTLESNRADSIEASTSGIENKDSGDPPPTTSADASKQNGNFTKYT